MWLTRLTALLFLPSLLLVNGAHEWTERALGFGARCIALIDEAAQSPLSLLATVPLLALIAVHAPRRPARDLVRSHRLAHEPRHRREPAATKYLNLLFPIDRGAYDQLPSLVLAVIGIAVALPLVVIVALRA